MRSGEVIEAVALGAGIAVIGIAGGLLLGLLLYSAANMISGHHPADCPTDTQSGRAA